MRYVGLVALTATFWIGVATMRAVLEELGVGQPEAPEVVPQMNPPSPLAPTTSAWERFSQERQMRRYGTAE